MTNKHDIEEAAHARLIAAISELNRVRYSALEVERRKMVAEHRKSVFDAHFKAGFTEMQALECAIRSI